MSKVSGWQSALNTAMGLGWRKQPSGGGMNYASFQRRLLANMADIVLLLIFLVPVIDFIVAATLGEVPLDFNASMAQARQEPNEELAAMKAMETLREARMPERWSLTIALQVFFFALYTQMFWHFYAATPGKLLLGMRILNDRTGQPMKDFQSMFRFAAYFIAMLPAAPLFLMTYGRVPLPLALFLALAAALLGFLWIGFDRKRQGWHDKLARTVVVVVPRMKKEEESVRSGSESVDRSDSPAPEAGE